MGQLLMLALINKIHCPRSVCLGFTSTSKINVVVLPLARALVGKNTCLTELQITLQLYHGKFDRVFQKVSRFRLKF
jgi:hypothetical protein